MSGSERSAKNASALETQCIWLRLHDGREPRVSRETFPAAVYTTRLGPQCKATRNSVSNEADFPGDREEVLTYHSHQPALTIDHGALKCGDKL